MGERVSIRPEADPQGEAGPAPVIDYGHADRRGGWWRWVEADARDRIDGFFRFIGQMIGLLGGSRRLGFAFALACLAGGLGECLSRGSGAGPLWMTIGGFTLGLCLPLRTKH